MSIASRSRLGRLPDVIAGVLLVSGSVLACGPAAPPGGSPTDGSAPATGTSPTVEPSAEGTAGPSPSLAGRDAPPDARLAAEGGDPVTGQLGSYVWFESGSDSPWLPGAPVAVGAGEPLTVSLVPDGDVRAWQARYVRADAEGPGGATPLGEGTGRPAFDAPGPGTWTVEVAVEFATGVGQANYFWRLEVE